MNLPINIFKGLKFKQRFHSLHIDILKCQARIICLCLGRRVGKTETGSQLFIKRFLSKLEVRRQRIKSGELPPWSGLGLPRKKAQRCMSDTVRGMIISQSHEENEQIRGILEARLRESGAEVLSHPDPLLGSAERPAQMWFVHGKAAGVIQFRIHQKDKNVRGSRADIIWIDEAGQAPDRLYNAVEPATWEFKADMILTGTPAFSEGHWYTKLVIAGLPPDHERANPKIAKPNPEIKTFLGSTHKHAYSLVARNEAKKKVDLFGKDSILVKNEIEADWRLPSIYALPWNAHEHLITLIMDRGSWVIKKQHTVEGQEPFRFTLSRPDRIMGGIDWFRGDAPAGGLVVAIWWNNPLNDHEETQPLVLVVDEFTVNNIDQSDLLYKKAKEAQMKWGVSLWYYDPFSPNIIKKARKSGILLSQKTEAGDKFGRVLILSSLMSYSNDTKPSLLVSSNCKTTAKQLGNYRRKRNKNGEYTSEFIQYDDWLVDSLAYIAPHLDTNLITGAMFGT